MKREKHPEWNGGPNCRAGLKAHELSQYFKEALEPRLKPGTLEGLKEDLDILAQAGNESAAETTEPKGYAGTHEEMLRRAAAWAGAVREALRRGKAPKDVLRAAGAGGRFREGRVDSALPSLRDIMAAYERFPDEFRSCGVLPDDMKDAKRILMSLNGAGLDHVRFKAKKPTTTTEYNHLIKRIEDAVDRVRAAGMLHFHESPDIAAKFAALVPPKQEAGRANGEQHQPEEQPKKP